MQIVVLSSDHLKEELESQGLAAGAEIIYISRAEDFFLYEKADAFIDLLFEKTEERIQLLQGLLPRTVIINSVVDTLQQIDPSFIRVNGWNTFLKSPSLEASASEAFQQKAEEVFRSFQKTIEWVPDVPGFITPRVVSTIINEAFLSLEEGVSSKEEMNTAMKLGTNYPYGPFEWAEKIGQENIARLLSTLSVQQPRYTPAALLVQPISSAN